MPQFTVHSVAGSPFGRAAIATLEEKGADWRYEPVAFRQPAHLALHPFARVPMLEHDGFSLLQTQAILRYLDRVLPTPKLTPADPRAAARMDQVMGVTDWYLFQGVCNVIAFHRIVSPRMGGTPDEAAIEAAMPKARVVIAELARLLGDAPFIAGDALTLADLHAAPQMLFLALTPEWPALIAGHDRLAAWLARMDARPSFAATTWARLAERAQGAPERAA